MSAKWKVKIFLALASEVFLSVRIISCAAEGVPLGLPSGVEMILTRTQKSISGQDILKQTCEVLRKRKNTIKGVRVQA